MKGKIKAFSDEEKLREFKTGKPTVKEYKGSLFRLKEIMPEVSLEREY